MNKFIPKNYKFKKLRKRLRTNLSIDYRSCNLKFSNFGLKIMQSTILSSVVFEAARRSITRKLKRTGKLLINGFPCVPLTKKSLGVRMGKGVGNITEWVFPVKKGRVLFELKNVSFEQAKSAFRSASFKLPVKTKFIYKIKK